MANYLAVVSFRGLDIRMWSGRGRIRVPSGSRGGLSVRVLTTESSRNMGAFTGHLIITGTKNTDFKARCLIFRVEMGCVLQQLQF